MADRPLGDGHASPAIQRNVDNADSVLARADEFCSRAALLMDDLEEAIRAFRAALGDRKDGHNARE